MDRYHVFSTNNMVDWINHGEILRRDNLPENQNGWGPHHRSAFFMWAPDASYRPGVVGPDGEPRGPYFFYFPHSTGHGCVASCPPNCPDSWGSNWKIGVAWSEHPHKDFRVGDPETGIANAVIMTDMFGNELTINGRQGGNLIDPSIFNDEGTYYFITGGSQECRIARLSDDMVSLAEPFTDLTSQLSRYHEGPWMFSRRNNSGVKIYYLMYPAHNNTGDGADMAYATSNHPKGPWTYRGSILDPVGTGDTSHGSIAEFNGRWYIFYHNANKSGGTNNLRSVVVDEVFFNPDGTIQKVKQTSVPLAYNGPVHDARQETELNRMFGAGTWTLEPRDRPPPPPPPNPDDYLLDREYPVTIAVNSPTPSPNVTVNPPAQIQLEAGDYVVGHFGGDGFLEFSNINGGTGGEVLLELEYARGEQGATSVRVNVNGSSDDNILQCPSTGSWVKPYQKAYIRITLQAGTNNTIRISGGAVNIRSISIHFRK
jgi:hypothetical protein